MNQMVIILASLSLTTALFAGALTIAWRQFGRERQAALWAAGFAAASAGHVSQLLRLTLPWMPPFLGAHTTIASMTLVALGFRHRAGLRDRDRAIVLGAATVAALTLVLPEGRYFRGAISLWSMTMLLLSAQAVRRNRDPDRSRGTAAFWFLTCFATYDLMLLCVGLSLPGQGRDAPDLFRMLFVLGVPSGLVGVGLSALTLLGADLAERLRHLAEVDPLTGLLNRRGFESAAGRMLAQAARAGRPTCVVVADLDHFKLVNDRFGHAAGDAVLRGFGDHAARSLRHNDLIGRLGGEEFAIVMADTHAGHAIAVVDRLRRGVPAAVGAPDLSIAVTASFGIATLDRHETLAHVLARADVALYRAKDEGRNRVALDPAIASLAA